MATPYERAGLDTGPGSGTSTGTSAGMGDETRLPAASGSEAEMEAGAVADADVEPAPTSHTEAEAGTEAEDVLARPEVAERLNRRLELHTKQFVRLFERALRDDPEAYERLVASRDGQRVLEAHKQRVQQEALAVAQQEVARLLAYRDLMQLRERDPATYAQYMSTREWRQFANEIEETYGDQLPSLIGLAGGQGQTQAQAQAQVQAQTQARAQAQSQYQPALRNDHLDLDRVFERLRTRPKAKYLSERDWEELDPVNFMDHDPSEAIALMYERFGELVERRQRQSPPAQVRAQQEAVRRAAAQSPPPVILSGPNWAVAMETDPAVQEIVEAYNVDKEANKKAYEQLRKRFGFPEL